MTYATQHARAYEQIKAKGDECIVTREGSTYDAATDATTEDDRYLHGFAVRLPGDPVRYEGLGLVTQHPLTLLFVSEFYLDEPTPAPGDAVWWNRENFTVRFADPIAPDGAPIVTEMVVVR